jgi:ubiquinone/menaquinone biosynthesis C-methylase UbiE
MTDLNALTQRHAQVWSNGPFEEVADTIADVHAALVETLQLQPGERWLDLGTGAGSVAELAAGAGAHVVGIDLSPRLVDVARERAAAAGFDIDYRVGDCQKLEGIEDAAFDVVSSSVGVMFAPDHAATAREIARVTRPGGRIGLAAWTKEGGVGRMFEMMAPFQPPPPEGAGSPFGWGDEEHVRGLLGDAFDLHFDRKISTHTAESGRACWELFSSSYGPTKTLAESLEPERREELAETWSRFFDTEYPAPGGIAHVREYLLVSGVRR